MILIPALSTTIRPACCPKSGLWSQWATDERCADTCGSCAQLTYRRKCQSEEGGCPCVGSYVKVENCNIGTCSFPRLSCCTPYTSTLVNGRNACGPQPPNFTEPLVDTSCCPTDGFWAEWDEWSGCTGASCFRCGSATRTRKCASDSYGCSCIGNNTETQSCIVLGTWSEWTVGFYTKRVCPKLLHPVTLVHVVLVSSRGKLVFAMRKEDAVACTVILHSQAYILPLYYCRGADEMHTICNTAPCANSTTKCCSGFDEMNQNGLKICGPLMFIMNYEEIKAFPLFQMNPPSVKPLMKCENRTCCAIGGLWTEWSSGSACSDTCGHCGTTTRTRGCISEQFGCPCSGPSTKQSECASTPCVFPRASCCGNRTVELASDKHWQCSSNDETSPSPSNTCWTCCPSTGGYWSEWTEGGACSDICGSCGQVTQSRTCLTEQHGCLCRDSCCSPYSSTLIDGKHTCGPQPNYTTPLVAVDPFCNNTCCPDNGIWSEWTVTPNECSDYCGSCGNTTKVRTCLSETNGCPCTGASTISTPCKTDTCNFPRLSCCPGFESMVINGRHTCGPLQAVEEDSSINTCGVDCCPSNGIWGEWSIIVPCNDTCGSCGTRVQSRKCLSLNYGCPCTGNAVEYQVCGTKVCTFPRATCCVGYTKKADLASKTFYCGPLPGELPFNPDQTTCCDPEKKGLWNEWTEWSACSANCGLCGTQARNRTCASALYGCECTGSNTESRNCDQAACTNGPVCCKGYPTIGYDGAIFCQPNTPVQCDGTWTQWMPNTGASCNDTCGMCGVIASHRYCWPSGCQCTGPFKAHQACASTVCTFPRTTCCAPYVRKIVNKHFVCA
uniref:ShKT domain-containing protein n=1 Tax=Haemonchus placei TaxID=6290 RepID=A0A0N4WQY5_HAEPC